MFSAAARKTTLLDPLVAIRLGGHARAQSDTKGWRNGDLASNPTLIEVLSSFTSRSDGR